MEWWPWYLVIGAGVGFIAGLFGVGGGLTIVPLLVMLFAAQSFAHEHLLHVALGTAMATMMFTSVSSMRAHHKHGAVRWRIVRYMAPGLMVGTFGGTLFAGAIPTRPLAVVFVCIVVIASLQIVMDVKPRPNRQLPGPVGLFGAGSGIGAVSSLVSAGGGFMSIPLMLFCNVPVHHAVGTSAALGFPIALMGTFGYIVSGWDAAELPPHSLGFVYVPGTIAVALATVTFAPLGARTAHRLPVKILKRAFGVMLALLAMRMLYGLMR